MKLQIITAIVSVSWIMGSAVTLLGTITIGFRICNFLLIHIFKQCKVWVWVVDYFINRRRFKAWLKSQHNH